MLALVAEVLERRAVSRVARVGGDLRLEGCCRSLGRDESGRWRARLGSGLAALSRIVLTVKCNGPRALGTQRHLEIVDLLTLKGHVATAAIGLLGAVPRIVLQLLVDCAELARWSSWRHLVRPSLLHGPKRTGPALSFVLTMLSSSSW